MVPAKDNEYIIGLYGKVSKSFTREDIEERLGYKIPEKDYMRFIKPYESLGRLKK